MSFPRVAIIILNWNGWEDTLECLESVYQTNYPEYDVIVVDNNSEDISIKKIEDYCAGYIKVDSNFFNYQNKNPIKIFEYSSNELQSSKLPEMDVINSVKPNEKLILIKNHKNYGFAKGNNIGISYALKSLDADYVLLLNNDTVVDKDFLTELVDAAKTNDNVGFVGPKVYIYSDKNTLQVAGGAKVDLKHGEVDEIAYHQRDEGQFDHYLEPDYIGGTCILCSREVIEEVGMLDPGYFMYWEDADWCFRGRKQGYKSVYAFKSKIWHKYGASSDTPFKMYYFTRNRIYFVKKNSTRGEFFLFSMFILAVTLSKSLRQLIRQRDSKMSYAYLKGFFDGITLSVNSKVKV
ncbi:MULTISPECIES: glycosyltransferase family 2 protein [Methanobacterium]|uniref:Glycosyltransferase family 2 protein n=1 Tax=Methanobacterium formicicum TaxID=2162 RepID=A0A843AMI5_METFO|nr:MULTISPECIES: glycosyltransferase family 2 protein [Methanobacterium]MBF4474611.1 glycosyltransferase family 2 protein [Methanobacterium formicicum]MDG3547405.1 glycosyltransferase family 2 protein [Methanobacterium formicicum]